jgi:hypothetical protein
MKHFERALQDLKIKKTFLLVNEFRRLGSVFGPGPRVQHCPWSGLVVGAAGAPMSKVGRCWALQGLREMMKRSDFIPRLIPSVRLAQVETQLHFTQDFNKKIFPVLAVI